MRDSLITLFDQSLGETPPGPEPSMEPESDLAKLGWLLLSPFFITVLFVAAACSIPITWLFRLSQAQQLRRLLVQMRTRDRVLQWDEFRSLVVEKQGTVIGESLSIKGPFRLWWTPQDVPALSPHPCNADTVPPYFEPEFAPFSKWCVMHYINLEEGSAKLVDVPKAEWKTLESVLANARYVTICTHPQYLSQA